MRAFSADVGTASAGEGDEKPTGETPAMVFAAMEPYVALAVESPIYDADINNVLA